MSSTEEKLLFSLLNFKSNDPIDSSNTILQAFTEDKWGIIFNNEEITELCSVVKLDLNTSELHAAFTDKIFAMLARNESNHELLAMFGISCLTIFLQANWTGPPIDFNTFDGINNDFKDIMTSSVYNDKAMKHFEGNDDDLYLLLKHPLLLYFAKLILQDTVDQFCMKTLKIWSIKYFASFIKIVEDIKDVHLKVFHNIFDSVEKYITTSANLSRETKGTFYVDSSHVFLAFYNYEKAEKCLNSAGNILGINISLTSALGKRTKFQYKELPQMKLNIEINKKRDLFKEKSIQDLPSDIELDDDTLLPEIKYVDGDSAKSLELSATDQAFIIANCVQIRRIRPRDNLSYEEILPYCEGVLKKPQSWVVQYKALFLRCITEFSNNRKATRALQQLESLYLDFTKDSPKAFSRRHFIQAVDFDPMWEHQRKYAQLLFSLGLNDSALEIFLKLQIWDDVISCYQRLGRHGKAETLIRQQLEIKETATLWNFLGDATMDKNYYEQAWEFSKHRNARSQKSLGFWYLRRQEYEQAIPHFEKSLELNSLQPGMAFSLGCACLAEKQLERAVKAFQKSVSLDPDMFESWSNLASCFIRLKRLPLAYKALQQATRLSHRNWKVWENFLLVCADIGAFDDVIYACRHLIDLGRKSLDNEVLRILVDSVIKDEKDMHDMNIKRLKPRVQKLFAHITSSITTDPNIWETFSTLCLSNNKHIEDEKALQYLYKSHRCYTQHTEWEKNESLLPSVMRVTMKMVEITKLVCDHVEGKTRAVSLYSTTKMSISNLVIRLKKAYQDDENNILESVLPAINKLEEQLSTLQNILQDLQTV